MQYDALIVLGRGVDEEGRIPQSAQATVKQAVELSKQGLAPRVIFSGKWYYGFDFIPPKTEARAMAEMAMELGLPEKAVVLEEESYTTITNSYFVKTRFLIPNKWNRVMIVGLKKLSQRALFMFRLLLGPEYYCDLFETDFQFPPDKQTFKEKFEALKIAEAKETIKKYNLKAGDHETIFQVTEEELKKIKASGERFGIPFKDLK